LKPFAQSIDANLKAFAIDADAALSAWAKQSRVNAGLTAAREAFEPLAEECRNLTKSLDHVFKLVSRLYEAAAPQTTSGRVRANGGTQLIETLDMLRHAANEELKKARYCHTQAAWLQDRFPDAKLVDVEGLVKVVGHDALEAND